MSRQPQPGAKRSEHFEIVEDYVLFRPVGEATMEQTAQWITDAIIFTREHNIRKLLVNLTDLFGFDPPSLGSRYFFVQDWARAAQGELLIAFAVRREMFDHEKISTVMAYNKGVRCDGFESEREAVAWLKTFPA